jgi:hypothetical protein
VPLPALLIDDIDRDGQTLLLGYPSVVTAGS